MAAEVFKDYLSTTKLTFSYKVVTILALLDIVDRDGKTNATHLIKAFHRFYLERQQQGLPAEKERERHPSPLIKPDEVTEAQIWHILTRYPLKLMEEFILVDGDIVRFRRNLWKQLSAADLVEIREIAQRRLDAYYESMK